MQSILLVEDDAKLAGLLAAYLTRNGFQVQVTDDFRHVLDEFVEVKPDLVLMDVNLPQYDGYYWCRQIRTHSMIGNHAIVDVNLLMNNKPLQWTNRAVEVALSNVEQPKKNDVVMVSAYNEEES